MRKFFKENKIFLAIIIGYLIVGAVIYILGQNRVKLVYMIISTTLVALPILGHLGYDPFYKNAMKALAELHELKHKKTVNQDGKTYNFKGGSVQRGDVGFNQLLSVVTQKRGLTFIAKTIREIGLAYGNLPLGTMISPNATVYIEYIKDGKETWNPIIFHPFDPNITLELRDFADWVKEASLTRINRYMLIIVPIWTVLGILLVFKS